MFKRISVLFIAVVTVLAVSGSANAVVITFDDIAGPGYTSLPSYSNFGYTLTSSSPSNDAFVITHPYYTYFTLSPALYNNYIHGNTTLSADSGGLFSLDAIDLGLLFSTGFADVTFYGYDLSGTLLGTYSIDLLVDGWHHVDFGGLFSNVGYVQWEQTLEYHQFDNITVSSASVPEPSTLLLLGSGLVGLGFVRRRFKK